MLIKSESTIEDKIHAYECVMARSEVMRSWRRQGATTTALLSGLIAGILIFALLGGVLPAAIIYGGFATIAAASIAWCAHQNIVKQRLETYFREQFGERKSFPVEVELTEAGISVKEYGIQITFEWANVEEVNETENMLEIYTRRGGGLFIKKKDISSANEYRQIVKLVQDCLNSSRTSSNWLKAS